MVEKSVLIDICSCYWLHAQVVRSSPSPLPLPCSGLGPKILTLVGRIPKMPVLVAHSCKAKTASREISAACHLVTPYK